MNSRSIAGLVVALMLTASSAHAIAPERKCRDAIRKSAVTANEALLKVLTPCERKIVAGDLPAGTDCATQRNVPRRIDKAHGKLTSTLTTGCAGKDLFDGVNDVPLVDVGWDLSGCPDLGGGLCATSIATHADVVTCLACLVDHGADGILDIAFRDLAPGAPQSLTRRCRATIGKVALKYARAKRNRLAKCWQALSKRGGVGSLCPTNIAEQDIADARAQIASKICKACADKQGCDGPGALSPATIGFPATCLDVAPVGAPSCAGAVTKPSEVAECVACVVDHHVDCTDRGAVPNFVHFPAECGTLPPP